MLDFRELSYNFAVAISNEADASKPTHDVEDIHTHTLP